MPRKSPGPNKLRASTDFNISLTLNPEQQEQVKQMLYQDIASCPMDNLRWRYLLLDLAYYMESCDHLTPGVKTNILNTIYQNVDLPVIQPNVDAAHAYLVNVFLTGTPIFGVVSERSTPEQKAAARQMEAIIDENSRMAGWARQLSLYFKSALKYNLSAVEVDWKTKRTFSSVTTDTSISFTQGVASPVLRAGNELRSLDMYNTFMDLSVSPGDIHSKGDFAGYYEQLTLAQLWQLVEDLKTNDGQVMNCEGDFLWQSTPYRNYYHTPRVLQNAVISEGTDWYNFLGLKDAPMQQGGVPLYEVVTYYRRIIPALLGITTVPDSKSVQVWKFIEVNGHIIWAERRTNFHNLLPIVFCQPTEDNLKSQTKGLSQNLYNYQNLANKMYRARLASLARSLSDRGLYDPSRVSEKNINSVLPTAKIPVRANAYSKSLSEAYYPIPYDDRNGQSLHMDIGQVFNYASDAAHINKAQRGQFTKGNRTLQEFDTIMDNAEAPQQAGALLIELQCMVPIKHQVKVNILQYQTTATLTDPNTREPVEIDPVSLRREVLEFKLADGLVPKERLLGVQATLEAFQIMSQVPGANQEWDLIGMMAEALEARGARLSHYRRDQLQAFPGNSEPPQQGAPAPEAQPPGVAPPV